MLPFVLQFLFLFCAAASGIRHTVSKRDQQASHRLYDDHVLWHRRIRSLRECSVLCATDDRCLAFTLVKNSTENAKLCRGYSEDASVLNEGSFSDLPGAVLFQVFARWSGDNGAEPQEEASTPRTSSTAASNAGPSTQTGSLSPADATSSAVPSTEEMTTGNVGVSSRGSTYATGEETSTAAEPSETTAQNSVSTVRTSPDDTTTAETGGAHSLYFVFRTLLVSSQPGHFPWWETRVAFPSCDMITHSTQPS